jgi:hypothetical protein
MFLFCSMARAKRRDSIYTITLERIERQAGLLRGEISAAQAQLTPFKAHYDALSELQDALVEALNALHDRPREWRDLRR